MAFKPKIRIGLACVFVAFLGLSIAAEARPLSHGPPQPKVEIDRDKP
jgi:hypothetical protein